MRLLLFVARGVVRVDGALEGFAGRELGSSREVSWRENCWHTVERAVGISWELDFGL